MVNTPETRWQWMSDNYRVSKSKATPPPLAEDNHPVIKQQRQFFNNCFKKHLFKLILQICQSIYNRRKLINVRIKDKP